MFEVTNILWLSVFMQCLAVILALRLIPETRKALAWILLSAAFLLMATRRTLSLLHQEGYMTDSWLHALSTEAVALVISILIVAGVYRIRRIFEQQREHIAQINKLSLAVEQNPSTTMILDTSGKIEYVNPAFTRATGLSADSVMGNDPHIFRPENLDGLLCPVAGIACKGHASGVDSWSGQCPVTTMRSGIFQINPALFWQLSYCQQVQAEHHTCAPS